jgi:23S rRNA (adenine2503-C2)-methyltransferase
MGYNSVWYKKQASHREIAGKMNDKPLIFDFNREQLNTLLESWGEPAFRSRQLWKGMYKNLWAAPDDFSNLSKTLRQKLNTFFRFSSLETLDQVHSSDQETVKSLFKLTDGHYIETILMHYRKRNSLCISSQAGCALRCTFCATGKLGFKRNLSRGEIIEQVIQHARIAQSQGQQLTNIVVMGMGEPFLNYDAVLDAITILNDPDGFGFGERRFTISTAGIVPGIERFTAERRQVNLAVSLHAANDNLRSTMMPINQKYPLSLLIKSCKDYTHTTKRRITFEWALIRGVNDQHQHAEELIKLIAGMLCHVNLIPLNPIDSDELQGSAQQQVNTFKNWLQDAGIPCSIRLGRGIDINAGCGQLAGRKNSIT